MSGHDPNCPILSFLTRLAGPAGGCRSSGWALVLLARLSLALVGGVVISFFPFRGRRPKDQHFSRYLPLSSGISVPCTRSPELAGHFGKKSVMDQMVGSRRSPGATILGGGRVQEPHLPTIAFWARRQVPKSVTGRSVDSVQMAGPELPDGYSVAASFLTRRRGSRIVRPMLRRFRLCVAAQASRTSCSDVFCNSRRRGVTFHVLSRQACLVR